MLVPLPLPLLCVPPLVESANLTERTEELREVAWDLAEEPRDAERSALHDLTLGDLERSAELAGFVFLALALGETVLLAIFK